MWTTAEVVCVKVLQKGLEEGERLLGLGGELEGGFELVFEGLHVEVDGAVEPFLVLFGGEGADEAQAALFVREDADDVGAAFDLLVEAFEEVGALEVFVVLPGLAVEGPGLLDLFFDPGAELRVFAGPFVEPGPELLAGFDDVPQVVEPAELGQAVVVGPAGKVVEGVAQEVDVAALPGGFGQDFGNGAFEAGVVVADGQADAGQAPLFQPEEELAPAGGALAAGQFDAEDAAAAFPVDPDGHKHGPAADDAVFADLLVAGVEDQVGVFAFEALALNSWPQSSSLMALTFRVETPCTYISTRAATRAFSLRW
jgi:hypothetical protein